MSPGRLQEIRDALNETVSIKKEVMIAELLVEVNRLRIELSASLAEMWRAEDKERIQWKPLLAAAKRSNTGCEQYLLQAIAACEEERDES